MGKYHYHNHKTKRRDPLGIVLVLLILAIAALLVVYFVRSKTPKTPETGAQPVISDQTTTAPRSSETEAPSQTLPSAETISTAPVTTEPATTEPATTEPEPEPDENAWKLVLVNADHLLPEDFTVELKALRNSQAVDERIYPELQQMFDDARKAGIYPLINESYRTAERQQQILDKYTAKYEGQGMSHEDALAKALTQVALPGASEHQLGLALDIIAEYDSDSTATWNWLRDNSWRYGFILRYPADKEEITGITYEPWHFRYVGVPTAQEITESGLCLEEYLAQKQP